MSLNLALRAKWGCLKAEKISSVCWISMLNQFCATEQSCSVDKNTAHYNFHLLPWLLIWAPAKLATSKYWVEKSWVLQTFSGCYSELCSILNNSVTSVQAYIDCVPLVDGIFESLSWMKLSNWVEADPGLKEVGCRIVSYCLPYLNTAQTSKN